MVDKTKLQKLVQDGIKAPSGHNTQPWQFKIEDSEIQIHPDFTRALPVVDSDNHALYISLGCAAENILIASTQKELSANLSVDKDKEGTNFIKINLHPNESVEPDELYRFIGDRQSTRNKYNDKKVPKADLEQLKNSFDFNGVNLLLVTEREEINGLKPYIIEGSNQQFRNQEFVNELVGWTRFSKRDAKRKGDGIWASSIGLPNLGKLIGNFVMKNFVSAKSEAKRWEGLIDASSGLALFVTNENSVEHWISLGRSFQRFGLTATKLNISHAHVNMPCEEMEVREKLTNYLNLGDKHPLLLLRFGYSDNMPYSFRRDSKEVIME